MDYIGFLLALVFILVSVVLATILLKDRKSKFSKSIRELGYHVFGNPYYNKAKELEPVERERLVAVLKCARDYTINIDFKEAIEIAKCKKITNIELFVYSYYIINQVDASFSLEMLRKVAEILKQNADDAKLKEEQNPESIDKSKSDQKIRQNVETFARSWADQINADLRISYETALRYINDKKDFSQLVSLDIMAKNEGLDIEERPLINQIDEEGLKLIIYAMIRANSAGIFLDDESSYRINKVQNINEYKDAFKITTTLLKNLYKNYHRDVTRFTNAMIRAHNAQLWLNFSESDLYALSDDDFDNLISNLIKAKNGGIIIDPKDLILHNVSGEQMNNLISAIIKAKAYGLSDQLNFNELMRYHVTTGSDVMKFVKSLRFIRENGLDLEINKDDLIEYSRPDADIYDCVQSMKIAAELEPTETENGITRRMVKKHFLEFGKVLETIKSIRKARKAGLSIDMVLAGKIIRSGKYSSLDEAISWALKPQVVEVKDCLTIVCKSGVQITPKINITVRGKMELIFVGYGLDILGKRINEAVVTKLESFDDHESILKNLSPISHEVLKMINEEEEKREIKTNPERATETQLNKYCAYQLLDVNIYDIIIGQNIKSELELRQAEIQSRKRIIQAEADRAKAEADLRIAMVQQYKDGTKPNFNELHKANLLNEKPKSIETGYEKDE
ncbi:MAG: flotillin-like FloA family protein [Bacteroidales bacterium]|nr:flotillin-like FloA family protein [Bacteroidales bacterium]